MTRTITTAPSTRRLARRRALRTLGVTALGATAALGLSACAGSGAPDLQDVWPEAYASIENATSVAVDGNVTQDGRDMTVSIAGQINDSSYAGNVAMDGVEIEIIGNTENTYMKPNTAFYEQNDGGRLQEMVGDQWLQTPAGEGGFTMSTLWDSLIGDIPAGDEFGNADYTSDEVELKGEQVYKYTGSHEDTGKPVSVYLSQDNKLVRIEAGSGSTDDASDDSSASTSPSASADAAADSGAGTLDFSQWDAVEPVDMPTEDEVFAVPGT